MSSMDSHGFFDVSIRCMAVVNSPFLMMFTLHNRFINFKNS
ncbi:27224_t:CDS:2 [Gigaspora margarita]|uniref:27224_t:CDS:1 n=1 Tax=Gigaspora margarita TaxID=4874 RepID=A0ABM8W0P2_GIGMA|nr:27224_t:CDS:2 [Gigaspora margarita]